LSAFFKALGHEPVTGAVKVEDFNESAGFVGEEEGSAAEWIELEMVAHQDGECVEVFTHVAGFDGDMNFKITVEGKHGVGL